MRLSQITDDYKEKFEIDEVIRDKDFSTLGLAVADIDTDFCTFIDNVKYIDQLSANASMVITTPRLSNLISGRGVCVSHNPRISFFRLHNYLVDSQEYMLTENFKTEIGHGCKISNMASIAGQNVRIGNNVTIEEFVSIKENTVIGQYVH